MRYPHKWIRIFFCTAIFLFLCFRPNLYARTQKWQGVDELVVERVAAENGRRPWKSLIDTEQGDLLLFAFLLAGAVGGFVLGFCWRKTFYEK